MATEKKQGQEKKKAAPPEAECAKVSKGKDKAAAKQKAATELASELKLLRATLKEIVKQISLRIDNRIADTLQVLEQKQAPEKACALPGAKTSLQLAKKLRGLKVKPDKGKLKDIARICQLVCKIAEKMPKKS